MEFCGTPTYKEASLTKSCFVTQYHRYRSSVVLFNLRVKFASHQILYESSL